MNSVLRRLLVVAAVLLLAGLVSGCSGSKAWLSSNEWTSPAMEDFRNFRAEEESYTPELKAEAKQFKTSQEQFWVRPKPVR